jgi:hypothetical protein
VGSGVGSRVSSGVVPVGRWVGTMEGGGEGESKCDGADVGGGESKANTAAWAWVGSL